jgi:acetoacetyl-CoA reductase/3-oxoacyl-[acyl-carrier protein] reductase
MTDEKKVILITGSSRGLGAHAAYGFAAQGHGVVVNYSKSHAEAEAVVRKIKSDFLNARVLSCRADVARREEVKGMFDAIHSHFGACDALITMAGINRDGPFLDMDDEQSQSVIRTVLTGTFICCQEFARRFKGENGRIVTIGATTAIKGRKNGVNYCSARAGVLNLTRCMALELAPNICVNALTPGFIETEEVMTRYSMHIPENYQKQVSLIPAGRLGTPQDVFKALDFLINGSSYITGQNFMVDGGLVMR